MSSRFSNRDKRCANCRISPPLCFCNILIKRDHETPVRIVMHKAEMTLTTNTAYFAEKMLSDCEILVRGLIDRPLDIETHIEDSNYTPLYLFPDEDSVELTSDFINSLDRPPLLVVPDGSWQQAKKFKRRESALSKMQSVKLPTNITSNYRLRTSPAPGAVCTYEAIAIALGICEGRELERDLLEVFQVITDRMYHSRKGIVTLAQLENILKKK
ncbi:tRNA-uridine aminocarboxypropyltransferase [Halobacteriovorax sp. JY17]|uniref:tRNA-uridine aminocarboxypropyltransferase n=1 Tax=Halobacteriovorax sp. JY17 TaxID=2014617 RepID=UPI000C415AE9|nr:tRNA-uridine aminocarboxypropyltransferase [Halobacteriovorax sp. JY17]PIK15708.1 MAG: hypothetical protein CES88_02980 [Halobacteriovorax sp. JY17]